MESIQSVHTESDGHAIWNGEYFGENGVLARHRELAYGGDIHMQMQLMSTLCSAISHCAAQVKHFRFQYLLYIWSLFWELSDLVADVSKDEDAAYGLNFGERDVLVTAINFTWLVNLNSNHRHLAGELVANTIEQKDVPKNTRIFAMARASTMWIFSSLRKQYLIEVSRAIYLSGPDAVDEKDRVLSWTEIARLARFVGAKERRRHAAEQSGKEDAKLKAGI
jgi:hypothetical protein